MLPTCRSYLTSTVVAGLVLALFPLVSNGDSEITPHWESATLTDHQITIDVERVRERWMIEHRIGEVLVRMRDSTIEAVDYESGEQLWSSEADIVGDLSYLLTHEGVLFVSAEKTYTEQNELQKYPCDIRRLRLEDGEWLPDVEIPLDETELEAMNRPVAALALDDGVLFLTVTEREGEFLDTERLSYRLTKLNDQNEVAWSKSFPSGGVVASPGAFILGTRGPAMDLAAIQYLTRLEGKVLVCGGPMEDIMLINPADGSAEWTLSRIWEFEKGFIGPSTWEHFIWRFGIQDLHGYLSMTPEEVAAENADDDGQRINIEHYEQMQQVLAEARQEVEGETANIVAGPIVVPLKDEYRSDFRLFVVTAQSDAPMWSNYLSECVVYEVDKRGEPHGMLTLPSFVVGEDYHVLDESLYWRCDSGAMARLYPSSVFGASNRTIAMDWNVTFLPAEREVWISKGSYYLTLDYRENYMLLIEEGGFIESRDALHLEFPISLVDLRTGTKRELIVDVPFEGRVEKPETNLSDGGDTWTAYSDYLIDLTHVEFQGDRIAVTFITDEYVEKPEPADGSYEEPEHVQHQLIFDAAAILRDAAAD
jgi:hypothetical protein